MPIFLPPPNDLNDYPLSSEDAVRLCGAGRDYWDADASLGTKLLEIVGDETADVLLTLEEATDLRTALQVLIDEGTYSDSLDGLRRGLDMLSN